MGILLGDNVHSAAAALHNIWTDRMAPYVECRSRYAIQMGLFYDGTGVRSVNSDLDAYDSDVTYQYLDQDDSREFLFPEHFDEDDHETRQSFSVEPASSSREYAHSEDQSDFESTEQSEVETILPKWISSNSLNALSGSTESTTKLPKFEFTRKTFLLAAFVVMLSIMAVVTYVVCYKLRHTKVDALEMAPMNISDSDILMESDLEMECGDVSDGEFITDSDTDYFSHDVSY